MQKRLVIVDPAVRQAEIDCFNFISKMATRPVCYHLPVLAGTASFTAENLNEVAGVVVLGSLASVNENTDWQSFLAGWLEQVFAKKIPTLGLCFGHQFIAKMMGAEVGYVETSHKKQLGLREVDISGSSVFGNQRGSLVVSHNECVRGVPNGMRVVGKSAAFANDVLEHKDLPIFTFQPHPEATLPFVKDRNIEGVTEVDLGFGTSLLQLFLKSLKN